MAEPSDARDPFVWPPEPVGLPVATGPKPVRVRRWLSGLALAVVLFDVPWACGRLWVPVFEWVGGSENPANRREFVIGRAVLVAPSLLAVALASAALAGRRPGRHREVALIALLLAVGWLFLVDFGVHWHAGD